MAKAALALILFAAPAPALAAAPPPGDMAAPAGAITAEEAMKLYEARVSAVMRGGGCHAGSDAEEIVVCGRVTSQRGEFPREPGEIVRHINEPGSGGAALAAGGCERLCDVGVRINVIKAIIGAPGAIRRLLGRD